MARPPTHLALLLAAAIVTITTVTPSRTSAQTAAPTPAPAQASPQPAPQTTPSPAPNPIPTLKANAQLVVVDVVVTDKNQRPIHGLKTSDFTLIEGSAPQTIKHFEEHTALTAAEATKAAPLPKLPPGIFTNFNPAPTNGPINLLLLDALNTPMKDQSFVRQQLLAYLNSAPPGTRIAIFGLTSRLTILQGFTSDPDILRNVLKKGLGKASPLLDDQVGGGGIHNSQADTLEDNANPQDLATAALIANLRQFDAEQESFQLQLRAKYTLDAMNQIARYLAGIPGRKNLIWFSGSFPINILPNADIQNPFAVIASSEDEFHETVNLLARSQVAVYPIDARGLFASPVYDASSSRNYGRNPTRMNQDQAKFSQATADENTTMRAMAEATGGRAFVNTNGLSQAVGAAIDEGSNFYTLTYTPTDSRRNGEFRKIKVQLSRPGPNLAYRHGYYADDPDKLVAKFKGRSTVADSAVTTGTGPNPQESMRVAMTRGSPTPAEILIKVAVIPAAPATPDGLQTEDKPAPNNTLSPKIHGPFRRYDVDYAINPLDVAFLRAADGKIHADIDLLIFVYDADGAMVNSAGDYVHLTPTLDQIKQSLNRGLLYKQQISAPAKGEYFLRIAVHDLNRDRFGAVEVATSQVSRLAPPIAPASRPQAPASSTPPASSLPGSSAPTPSAITSPPASTSAPSPPGSAPTAPPTTPASVTVRH